MTLHVSHLHAQDVSSRAFAASWSDDQFTRGHLVSEARDRLVQLLAGEPAGSGPKHSRDALIKLMSQAIDADEKPEAQAQAILQIILDKSLPMPAEAQS